MNTRLATLFLGLLLPIRAWSQSLNSVTPNPSTYGTPVQFLFIAYAVDCDYDVQLRSVGREGNVLRVQYDLVIRIPPVICFATPPPLGATVNLGVLPPGQYVARSEGFLDGNLVYSGQAAFRVLGVTSESVPALSRWALTLLGSLVLGIALFGRRWISPGA
jgi:hypothetical protein